MPGLVPGIHVLGTKKGVDGRDKPGHDDGWRSKIHRPDEESAMRGKTWLGITKRERDMLLDALVSLRRSSPDRSRDIDLLTAKLVHSRPYPEITIGVHGGQVQWTLGNPFPIRICDYDGDREDLPDVDGRGQRCRIWFESASSRRSA